MMKLSLFGRVLTSFLLCVTLVAPAPARAASDGDLCNGLMMLICLPVVLGATIVDQFTPATAQQKMTAAVDEGNLKQVKQLLKRQDVFKPNEVLREAARSYLEARDATKDRDRLQVVQYLVEEGGVDLSGETGTALLQNTVDLMTFEFQPLENGWKKRLQLARLAIAHGASAKDVKLGMCRKCEDDVELLPLLISNGASPNGAIPHMSTPLLVQFIKEDQFDAAERLLRLGADANGADPNQRGIDGQSMLFRLVAQCSAQGADWQPCIDRATARISFAISHGADPNGRATMENNCECLTPYDFALSKQHTQLARLLLKMGAAADYSAH